jgi:hypothetical protein
MKGSKAPITNKVYADVPRRSGETAETGGKGPSYMWQGKR